MKKKRFHKSQDIVKKLLENLGINEENFALFDLWEREAGALAQFSEVVGFKNGIMTVRTNSPLYYQEIALNKGTIIKKINGYYGKKVLEDIKVQNTNNGTR